jgi:hypothetical protein
MCAVSMVHDYFTQQPATIWTRDTFAEYQEIIGRLGELDRKLGQPDCDPNKAEWMKGIERRLEVLEKV